MITREEKINAGDTIRAMGYSFTVGTVFYQDYFGTKERANGTDWWGYDVEFKDTNGEYHHWLQYQDGGELIRK